MLAESREQTAALAKRQNLLFGYAAAMRQLPAYLSFCRKYPKDGNAKLVEKIAAGFRRLVLTGKMPAKMADWIELLDEQFVPDMDDFGSESRAMEAAIAWICLYKYARTSRRKKIVEILLGLTEMCGFTENASMRLRAMREERSIRQRQFELIRSSRSTTRKLLDECLAIK